MSSDSFITWNEGDSGDKAKAFEKFSDSIESYDCLLYTSDAADE